MTFHAFKQLLKYKWIAKTRHGVHSPFVFDFVEKVLRDKTRGSFERKLINYFNEYPITWRDISEINLHLADVPADEIIIIRNIHRDEAATQHWAALANDPAVKLSIDIYNYGLLFFRTSFKEKQHFVLKYPG
ncbi:hypothetical protein [Taibaiella soli]|uniref:Uncharacterized protein n=1 Tax=Taibaiella soli TaxID=1649169 RepID=A0A2W2ABY2_9BACT|nr:hypothetical protein [Taibaiella soli]PZF72925.1 hypothetical protein DN068_10970 [Taibaiella soli]